LSGGVAGQYFLIQLIQLAIGNIRDQKREEGRGKLRFFHGRPWTPCRRYGDLEGGGGIWKLNASYGKLWVWSETECR